MSDCRAEVLKRYLVSRRYLVREAQAMGVEIIDRCNLTVLQEPGQEDLADFLAEHKVIPFCALSIHLLAAMSASPTSMVCT